MSRTRDQRVKSGGVVPLIGFCLPRTVTPGQAKRSYFTSRGRTSLRDDALSSAVLSDGAGDAPGPPRPRTRRAAPPIASAVSAPFWTPIGDSAATVRTGGSCFGGPPTAGRRGPGSPARSAAGADPAATAGRRRADICRCPMGSCPGSRPTGSVGRHERRRSAVERPSAAARAPRPWRPAWRRNASRRRSPAAAGGPRAAAWCSRSAAQLSAPQLPYARPMTPAALPQTLIGALTGAWIWLPPPMLCRPVV